MQVRRKRLGDVLIEVGIIGPEELKKALEEQNKTGERLGPTLIKLGYIKEEALVQILEYQLGIPLIDLSKNHPDPEIAKLISQKVARTNTVIPVEVNSQKKLVLAMQDPLDLQLIEDMRIRTGYEIEPVLATEQGITKAIEDTYALIDDVLTDELAVARMANEIIKLALIRDVNDCHLEPQKDQLTVWTRGGGGYTELMTVSKATQEPLVERFKTMSTLNIHEKGIHQEGYMIYNYRGKNIVLIVNIYPTIYGEKVHLLLSQRGVLDVLWGEVDRFREKQKEVESIIRKIV